MKLFAKRVFGFRPSRWPVVAFGQDSSRDSLLRESSPGDLVMFVGTLTSDTEPEDQGRLLGLVEFE